MDKQLSSDQLTDKDSAFSFLKKSRLFGVLNDSELDLLMPLSRLVFFNDGEKLLSEGEVCEDFHLLLAGRLGIYLEGEPIIELKRKGDIVGEMSVIASKPCGATVRAVGDVTVFSIGASEIGSYVKRHSGQLENTMYRLFAMMMTDKLTMTTDRAKRFEQEHRQIRNARSDLKVARKMLEEQVVELADAKNKAEAANQAKSDFLANVSHELRNPMHQVLSYSKNGIDKIEKPKDKLLFYFCQIRKSASRLMVFLNDLLDLSKMESGKMTYTMATTDLWQIVESATGEFVSYFREKNIELMLLKPSVSSQLTCDDFRIGQVIRNLVSNALKYTPQGRSVEISLEKSSLPEGKRSSDTNRIPALVLSVRDQGVGIPEDELISVFDKFVQSSTTSARARGTGLGLAICKEIVDAHHGKIWAESNVASGVTFYLLLPLVPPAIELS